MNRVFSKFAFVGIALAAGSAIAQPSITSLGGGVPLSVTNSLSGSYYIGGSGLTTTGAARWTLTGSTLSATEIGGSGGGYMSADGLYETSTVLNTSPSIVGNTATAVSPPFSLTPTLVPATNLPATTEFAGRRWSFGSSSFQSLGGLPIVPSLMVYGSGSSGSSTSSFLTPNAISATGRFVVGLGYVSIYSSSAGTTISANSFQWRPWIWDAQANAGAGGITVLPTPFRTSSNTWRRRTGNAYCVSSDGLVIAGAQEHNSAVGPAADPDGARFVVWRWNAGTSTYDMSFLPNGVDGSGFPYTYSSTPGSLAMNAAGTIIAGRAADATGNLYLAKWVWNAGTSSWDAPINLGSNLNTPASWLPFAVTSCAIPPSIGGSITMSDDGNTIGGSAVYSTCGSFMSGGFIWHNSDGQIRDWYDYLASLNTPGVTTGGVYGPIGDNGDPALGLPALGYPTAISPNGNAVTSFQGGTQRIPGAASTILLFTGGPSCVAPSITLNPAAVTNFSACSSSLILNVAASGTGPFTYQWYKNGSPLTDGATGNGSAITGATSFQFRINGPYTPADAGTYYVIVTGQCGTPAQSTNAVVQVDPAYPAAINDTCTTATTVNQGTNVLAIAESPCGAYINDPLSVPSCATAGIKTDRWYVFTPTTSGNYRFDTCGSNFDTLMSVYPNSCGSSELACNNDLNTGPTTNPTCSSQRSRLSSVALTANTPYYIQVAAPAAAFLSAGTSTINLSINPAPVLPSNDSCNNAAAAVLGVNAFNTTEATADGIVALSCASSSHQSRDVWYTYTPSIPGRLTATTCPTGTAPSGYSLMTNTVLSFHSSPCGAVLSCNDNLSPVPAGCGTSLSTISRFPVQAATPTWIRVAGSNSSTFGAGQLNLSLGCIADYDDGSGNGIPDGGVGIEDLLYYLGQYNAGTVAADVDNGSALGIPDGGVGIEDLLFYLTRFNAGC